MEATKRNNLQSIPIVLGALGVGIGAFGAHMLQPIIEAVGRQSTWDTAMFYYWVHVLAMLAITHTHHPSQKRCVYTWLPSICLFSGSLWALSMGAPRFMGAITPIGGLGFIVGWLLLLGNEK